ncbi:MAG: ATP phosphoribosyltransferase regulatory subunit, partial [Baekduiaceae bacterium]
MIHPLPSGTRDVLPDESRELRAITEAMRGVFEQAGYGEVWTPAIEYESVVGRGDDGRGVYRLFDDHGEVLLLRSDLTVPIARLAATRYAPAAFPLRLSTFAHVYRGRDFQTHLARSCMRHDRFAEAPQTLQPAL